jgi:hypothetical protein
MSKNSLQINSGVKGLDKDLVEFLGLCESERLEPVKNAIKNKNASPEELEKLIPNSIIRIIVALSGLQYHFLLDRVHKESIPFIEKARSLIEKHFGDFFENHAVRTLVSRVVEQNEDEEESLEDNCVNSISYFLTWEDGPPELTPSAMIGLKNKKGKILCDIRAGWDNLSYLISALSQVLVNLLENGKVFADKGQIDLSDSENVARHIKKLSEQIDEIKKIAPAYKIILEEPVEKTDKKDNEK